ncbi:MAG TPA: hypothetical protein VK754_09585, partial [Propionibacteriaceae bacterium]|nr:hypothetical protein [Propionibacteriaceae bacterium]
SLRHLWQRPSAKALGIDQQVSRFDMVCIQQASSCRADAMRLSTLKKDLTARDSEPVGVNFLYLICAAVTVMSQR